ncbi:MAG: hypothetical protein LBO69_06995 [Ignavibacteria bacterium]|jgi:hypothetical protein|nr:hypothetical protein [Ignavibacteria bacterium]
MGIGETRFLTFRLIKDNQIVSKYDNVIQITRGRKDYKMPTNSIRVGRRESIDYDRNYLTHPHSPLIYKK